MGLETFTLPASLEGALQRLDSDFAHCLTAFQMELEGIGEDEEGYAFYLLAERLRTYIRITGDDD